MSLDWNISKIENFKELWVQDGENKRLNRTTDSLIWAAMAVDLGSITEKNVDKWLERLSAISVLDNNCWDDLVHRHVIERHIGLTCNVCNMTDAKFWNKMKKSLQNKASDKIRSIAHKDKKDTEAKLTVVK